MERWEKLQISKQMQALQAKDSSLQLWEGKLKQDLKWHFFFFFALTMSPKRGQMVFSPMDMSKTKQILSYIASGLQNAEVRPLKNLESIL